MAQSKPYNNAGAAYSYIDAASEEEVLEYVYDSIQQLKTISQRKGFVILTEILGLADSVGGKAVDRRLGHMAPIMAPGRTAS